MDGSPDDTIPMDEDSLLGEFMDHSEPPKETSALWVSKYEAKNFADLLSDGVRFYSSGF